MPSKKRFMSKSNRAHLEQKPRQYHVTPQRRIVHISIRSDDKITPIDDTIRRHPQEPLSPERISKQVSTTKTGYPLKESSGKDSYLWQNHTIDSNQTFVGQSGKYGLTNDRDKKRKRRRALGSQFCCTPCCQVLCMFGCVLAAMSIAALLTGLLIKNQGSTKESTSTSHSSTLTTSTFRTSTTTTPRTCGFSCLNRTWISTSDLLAKWKFDGTFLDDMSTYPATPVNNPTFISNGYIEQGLFFDGISNQYLYTSYIPLIATSFTVEAWLYPMNTSNQTDLAILGLCTYPGNDHCLHLTIRKISSFHRLHFSFFGDNISGNDSVPMNQWIHVAFTFDNSTHRMSIYLNGKLSMFGVSVFPLLGDTTQNVTIGYIPKIVPAHGNNFFHGYMDHMTISGRAKPACEILDDASLAALYNFDNTLMLNDTGPNTLSSTFQSVSFISSGHLVNALSFTTVTSSLQISHLTGLGTIDKSFSISLWIRPVTLSGTLVFVSQTASGSIWCFSFMGFAANGSIVGQIWTGLARAVYGPALNTSSTWHHIVQTWSSINGLRLYVNNVLVASDPVAISYQASSAPNYVTLANRPNNACSLGAIALPTYYSGSIDDFRIYSRELTTDDVCALYFW